MKGKWTVEISVELEGVSYLFRELKPTTRRRILRAVGRGILSGSLSESDFRRLAKARG